MSCVWQCTGVPIHLESERTDRTIADNTCPYSLEEISLSYNGGKDCLVLLILFLAALAPSSDPTAPKHKLPASLQSVYIISPHPFAEVDYFVKESTEAYQLDLAHYALPMKEAFEVYLRDKPNVKAIMVGTRRTDPHGANLTHFDMTDQGWPSFMRIHPVIDWHYAEIWAVRMPLPNVRRASPRRGLRNTH
jgi:FAD synthetase